MKQVNFPAWAPDQVISIWREKDADADYWLEEFPMVERDSEISDLYIRLLTYNDMRSVWERLPKYKIKPSLFSIMIEIAYLYRQSSPDTLAPLQYEQWLAKLKETAKTLEGLIRYSEFDGLLDKQYYKKRQRLVVHDIFQHSARKVFTPDKANSYNGEPPSNSWPNIPPGNFSDNLKLLGTVEPDQERRVQMDRPNHPNAKRIYFVKSLTAQLRKETGKPLRDIVTKTTATVFDDPKITERQIFRMAP